MKFVPMILKHVTVSRKRKTSSSNSKNRKCKVINNRKIMKNKSKELSELKFSNNLYISETMCTDNQVLFSKCQKLKTSRKICITWFFNNAINAQLNQSREIHKVFHTEDLAALLKVDDLHSFLMNLQEVWNLLSLLLKSNFLSFVTSLPLTF